MKDYQTNLKGEKIELYKGRTHEIIVRAVTGKCVKGQQNSYTISICTGMKTKDIHSMIRGFVSCLK